MKVSAEELDHRLSVATALLVSAMIRLGVDELRVDPPDPSKGELPPEWERIDRIGMGTESNPDGSVTIYAILKGAKPS